MSKLGYKIKRVTLGFSFIKFKNYLYTLEVSPNYGIIQAFSEAEIFIYSTLLILLKNEEIEMVDQSAFRGALLFLDQVGIYDVVLPFLLVFTIVFAILDKTKILGIEKIGDKEVTKKNLNAMVAFVVAMLVIASTQLVAHINKIMSDVVLLIILGVSFLMLVGVFFTDKQFSLEQFPGWTRFFMILMFIGIVIIFLNALDWLQYIQTLFENWNAQWAATIIFLIIIVGFMWYIVRDNQPKEKEKK